MSGPGTKPENPARRTFFALSLTQYLGPPKYTANTLFFLDTFLRNSVNSKLQDAYWTYHHTYTYTFIRLPGWNENESRQHLS